MECISNDQFLKFNPDTMGFLKKKYNFDKPGEMNEAVHLLHDWVKEQKHFVKKDFPRPYLERIIISNKGSVERAKSQLDKLCTLRTLLPHFFDKYDAKNDLKVLRGHISHTILKDLTDDHYRVNILKLVPSAKQDSKIYFSLYVHFILFNEYVKAYDYCNGFITILDLRGVNIVDAVTELNLNEMTQMTTITIKGFGARVKQILIISESKAIDLVVKVLKQVLSNKIASRMQVLSTVDELYQYIPKNKLPADLGGGDKPMGQLHDFLSASTKTGQVRVGLAHRGFRTNTRLYVSVCRDPLSQERSQELIYLVRDEFTEELSRPENIRYFKEMSNARTDESLRSTATFNEQYLGIAGTFRTLNVD